MLELAILGLLKEQELHGYELKKRLADTVGSGTGVSFGSLYPALSRLEKAGAVRVAPVPAAFGAGFGTVSGASSGAGFAVGLAAGEPTVPGAGTAEAVSLRGSKAVARGGRGKKVYAITDRGELLFEELLAADADSSEDERSFNLRLAFARHLSRDARIGMLERRRAYLLERLARRRGAIRHGWGRFDAYTRSIMEHGNETTERDISWLDRLIARERDEDASISELPAFPAMPSDAGPTAGVIPWAALAPPTMPVPPAVSTSSHPRGGNIS